MKIKIAAILISLCLILPLIPHEAYASDVSVDEDITYNCDIQEKCIVTNTVTITNISSKFYASEYILSTSLNSISNIRAKTKKGAVLLTSIERNKENNYIKYIKVVFNKAILGKGSTFAFDVSFETNEIAKEYGKVWEVAIPKVVPTPEIKNAKVTLIVPNSYGQGGSFYPQPNATEKGRNSTKYTFSKNQILNDGIKATFGKYQLFNFDITYRIRNDDDFFSKNTSFPIPPDVKDRQEVYLLGIKPGPKKIEVDDNGNFLAQYKLEAQESLKIRVYGIVKIFDKVIDIKEGGKFSDIPRKLVENYTKPRKYWESDNSEIINIVKETIDKNKNVSQNAKALYTFVTHKLNYSKENIDRQYLERHGALKALKYPNDAVCMEFTDLLIALLRSAGIPAREINGFAYSKDIYKRPVSVFYDNNKDLLHSWVEYYDPNLGWVPIDPTWGSTSGLNYFSKLDLNHILFVRKANPEYPLPPGAYKTENEGKTLTITFGNDGLLEKIRTPQIDLKQELLYTVIKNTGKTSIFNVRNKNGKALAKIIPPYGTLVINPLARGKIKYQDFEGDNYTLNVSLNTPTLILFLALGLCMSLLVSVALLKVRKK